MKTVVFVCSLIVFSCFGCTQKDMKKKVDDVVVEVQIPEGFEDFYKRFHEDTVFQKNRIAFPLEDPFSKITWTETNWILHKPYDDFDGTFQRSFRYAEQFVFEEIGDANGFFTLKRRWANMSDGWNLIYYTVESKTM